MTDPLERQLRDLLDDRARGDPLTAELLAEGIAALPARRGWRLGLLVPLAAAVVVVVVLAGVVGPRPAGTGGDASPSAPTASPHASGPVLPGGPEAFAGDPRLGRCSFGPIEYAFVMTHARDYRHYFPNIGFSPELDVDASAFVAVFRQEMAQPPTTGRGPGATNEPGHRYVCVVVQESDPILYGDVDITGLTVDVVPSESPSVAPTGSPAASLSVDAGAAFDLAKRYESARAVGDFATAWSLLSTDGQTSIGDEATFAANESAYNASGGAAFDIQAPTQDADVMATFLGTTPEAFAPDADGARAYLVFIAHPNVVGASAGSTGLFVAPLETGEWRIWIVH